MEIPGRRYLCAGCRKAVVICRYCDRGNRYCDRACSQAARQRHQHAAGQRYRLLGVGVTPTPNASVATVRGSRK